MKILVATMLFAPDRAGIGSVATEFCVGLAERGHDVTVFTTHPYYPEWKRKTDASPWPIAREDYRGVKVRRFGHYVPAQPKSLIARLLIEATFLPSLLRSLWKAERYDVVVSYCPLTSVVAYTAVRRLVFGEPVWLNIQDIPADAAAATGISKSRFFNRFAGWVQKVMFSCAEFVTSISPSMVDRVRNIVPAEKPTALFPNWLSGTMAEHVNRMPSKVGRPVGKPPVLLYAGNINAKQGLREFCERLQKLDVPFEFRIHGDGPEAPNVRNFVEQSGDTRFRFGPFLDEAGFIRALHEADVYVITEKPGVGASFIPSKLIPGIATGTPVLGICDPEGPLGREMREGQLGLNVPWSEYDTLAARLEAFLADPVRYEQCQKNCLERAQLYNREAALDHAESILARLAPKAIAARTVAAAEAASPADETAVTA